MTPHTPLSAIPKLLFFALLAWSIPVSLPAASEDSSLPVLRAKDTVVFIGDSITDGGRARTGNDYNHTMGQSYAFIIAATLGTRLAEQDLTFINRGISGNTVTDLQARWQTDVIALKPDVLSILVGINDTFSSKGETLEQFEQRYDQILRDTLAALPKVRIILGEPFVLPVGKYKDNFAATRAEVEKRQRVVASLAAKYHLPIVHYQKAFDEAQNQAPAGHWSWDGIHPHYAGHGLVADEWLRTVGQLGGQNHKVIQ